MIGRTERLTAERIATASARLGEGPVWDERAAHLIWVDIVQGAVHLYDPASGADRSMSVGQHVGAAAPRRGEGLVLAVRDGFALWAGGTLVPVAIVDPDPEMRMNDGKVDPAGRFWAGTMAYDERAGAGALYRLDPDHSVHRMIDGLTISNGLDWSLDDRVMYFIDSGEGGIDAFDYDVASGSIAKRRRVVQIDGELGVPDGMTLDGEGCLWVALWDAGEVRRFSPDGDLLAVVDVPTSGVTSCAFGGADLSDLYITSADVDGPGDVGTAGPHSGGLFRCRTEVRGRVANRFRG